MLLLITGASSGIGESLARISAMRRHDLILVARRIEKLNELAKELKDQFDINVEVIQADLTKDNELKAVENRIELGDVNILVNNAGFGSSGPFVELNIANELNEIDLNIRALVRLSHVAAKHMVENKTGTIVNISSIAGYQPMTGNAVYGGTKAFVNSFSHALSQELKPDGVRVMVVCPGLTKTEFQSRSKWFESTKDDPMPNFLWQSAQEVANSIFNGIDRQKTLVVPGPMNKILVGISSSLPAGLTKKITAVVAKGRRTR